MTGCQTCGTPAAPDARFCSHCGANLGDRSTSVDPAIRNQVLTTLRAEHRLVTVVFADMTGSVKRTRHLDAERATELVNPLLETMVELMVHHGGRIDRFLGDGVLAAFGVPNAHEDDPIRAIRAALGLRERASELGLDVTVGVNTGRVYFGPVGSSLHEELTVMGPVVNLAARLQAAAGPGEVIVGASTRAHIHASFEVERRHLEIKGLDEPVEAFAVKRLAASPDKVRGVEGLTSRLVGREAELTRLRGAIDAAETVAVIGEAGLGKSRLFREARNGDSRMWLEARCRDLTSSVPFAGIADLMARHIGGTAPADVLGSMNDLHTLSPEEVDAIMPFLVHMLGGSLGDERDQRVTESDPAMRARLTVDAIVRWLTAISQQHQLVVFVDDLHWADPLTVDTLDALARIGPSVAVAVASRPEPSAALDRLDSAADRIELIHLQELDARHTKELTRLLLTISGLPTEAESQLVHWARGNPFYVEELLRSFIDRDMIVRSEGRWVPGPVPIALELPESIDGLVMSRFDRLPTETRRIGQLAAVLYRPFDDELLNAVASIDSGPQLEQLTDAGFLTRSGSNRSFTHDLIREAVYQSLLPSQQLELHGRVGDTVKETDPDDHETLAFHFERSSNHEAAVEELLKVATRSFDAYANDIAADHIARGLSRIEQLPPDHRDRWTARYLLIRGQLGERRSDYDEALDDLVAARALAEPGSPITAEILRITARVHRMRDEYEEAFAALDDASTLIDVHEDPQAWIAVGEERAHCLYFGGRGRELPGLIETLHPVVERHGSRAQRADLIGQQAFHRFIEEHFALGDGAVTLCRQALELTADSDPGRLATAQFRLGFCLLWADRSEEAIEHLERARASGQRVGDAMLENRAASYLAIAYRRTNQVQRAKEAAEVALRIATEVGDRYYVGHAEAVLGWAEWRSGDPGVAERSLERALDAWGHVEGRGSSGVNVEFAWLAAWPLAAIASEQGDLQAAASHLRLVTVPWERPMPQELERAVTAIESDPTREAIAAALELARTCSLL